MQTPTKMTIWIVVLLLACGALLAACGGGTPSPGPAVTTVAPVQAPATAVIAPATDAPPASATEAAPAIDAAALLQARCVDCHSLSRTTGARYTQAEWQAVVTRMIKHGAALNPDEEAALVAYLAETYKP